MPHLAASLGHPALMHQRYCCVGFLDCGISTASLTWVGTSATQRHRWLFYIDLYFLAANLVCLVTHGLIGRLVPLHWPTLPYGHWGPVPRTWLVADFKFIALLVLMGDRRAHSVEVGVLMLASARFPQRGRHHCQTRQSRTTHNVLRCAGC